MFADLVISPFQLAILGHVSFAK